MNKYLLAAAVVASCAGMASASVRLSELFLNPPGTDNGQEFVELIGTPGQSLANTWLLVIEGDSTATGVIDQAINLSSLTLGSNGLLLLRDAAGVIDASAAAGVQGPSAGTTLNVADFAPDLENGSNTYLLVTGFTGAVGSDVDVNNDGILDATAWASVVDGIGFLENDGAGSNFAYAAALGFTNFAAQAGFNADVLVLGQDNAWYGADVLGTNPGGFYAFDVANGRTTYTGTTGELGATPGILNSIPTPGAIALAGMGGLLVARRRRA